MVLGLALAALPARAQESWNPYSTTVYREGPGFRLGSAPLTLHPGLAVEGGYDTNVFYAPSDQVAQGSGLLRLRAHLDLGTLTPQRLDEQPSSADPKVDFRFSTQVEYREYLTSNPDIQSQRSVNLVAAADLSILPRGPFTLRISDSFVRSVDPRNEEGPRNFTRDFNRAGILASYKFPGARLEIGVGDFVEFNFWESRDIQFGNTIADDAQAYARYRFLQQTVGSLLVRAGYRTYTNISKGQLDSAPVRVLAGVSSLITTWFGVAGAIGYGNSIALAKGRSSFNSALANAELRFFLPRGSRLSLGYDRDFFDSLFANFYVDDKLYLAFDQPLIYRLVAHIDGGVRFRHYEGLVDPSLINYVSYSPNNDTRDDLVYDAHAELNVQALSWLSCGVSYNLIADHTDFAFVPAAPGAPVHVDYLKHAVFARVDIAY